MSDGDRVLNTGMPIYQLIEVVLEFHATLGHHHDFMAVSGFDDLLAGAPRKLVIAFYRYGTRCFQALNVEFSLFKIMDLGNDIALTVFGRNGERAYSVSPQQFNRAYERDVMQQIERDFRHGVVVEFTGEAA